MRRVKAGEDRERQRKAGERAMSALSEPESASGDRTRLRWTAAATGNERAAELVKTEWESIYGKSQTGLKETRTLLQLFHQIPSDYPDIKVGAILTWDQLKKLGRNIMAKAGASAIARLMKPAVVQVATADGSDAQDLAARAATKAVKGLNAENDSLQVETKMVYDGWLSHRGRGYAVWLPDANKDAKLYWLDPTETWLSSDKKEVITRRFLPRREVMALYGTDPEKKAMIRRAPENHPEPIEGVDDLDEVDIEDTIAVYYAWVEACGDDAPAWQVVQLETGVLVNEEFPLPIHPVWWIDCVAGFRQGMARPKGRQIAPYSYWINSLQQSLWEQLQGSKVHVVGEAGTKIHTPNDRNYQKVTHAKGKTPPKIYIPDTVSPHIERNLQQLEKDALAEVGVSEAAAEGTIPGGVTSGIAITKYQNEVAIALSETAHNINIGRLRSARIACYWMAELYKSKPVLVKAENSEDLEAINWPALNMKERKWTITIQTAGALPDTVAGKQQVSDWFIERGVADPLDAMEIFENPDLQRLFGRKLRQRRLVRMQISKIMDATDGQPIRIYGPDATQDAQLGVDLVGDAYQEARIKGKASRAKMDALFRLYILFRDRLQQPGTGPAQQPAAAATPVAAGGAPPAQATPQTGSEVAAQQAAATTQAQGVV